MTNIIIDEIMLESVEDVCNERVCVGDKIIEDSINVAEINNVVELDKITSLHFNPEDGQLTYSEDVATFVGKFKYSCTDEGIDVVDGRND